MRHIVYFQNQKKKQTSVSAQREPTLNFSFLGSVFAEPDFAVHYRSFTGILPKRVGLSRFRQVDGKKSAKMWICAKSCVDSESATQNLVAPRNRELLYVHGIRVDASFFQKSLLVFQIARSQGQVTLFCPNFLLKMAKLSYFLNIKLVLKNYQKVNN